MWNLDRLTKLKTLRGHNCIVTSAALSRDLRFAATGDERGTIKVWSIRTGRLLREWPGDDFALHPNGERIVTRGNSTPLRLWELSSGRLIAEWEGRASHDVGLVFSADGRRLFAGAAAGGESDFGTLQVWDLDDSPRQALSLDESSSLWRVVACPEVKDRQVIVASTWLGLRQWEMFPWKTAAYVEDDGQAAAGRNPLRSFRRGSGATRRGTGANE